jgi:hypothetical protein
MLGISKFPHRSDGEWKINKKRATGRNDRNRKRQGETHKFYSLPLRSKKKFPSVPVHRKRVGWGGTHNNMRPTRGEEVEEDVTTDDLYIRQLRTLDSIYFRPFKFLHSAYRHTHFNSCNNFSYILCGARRITTQSSAVSTC